MTKKIELEEDLKLTDIGKAFIDDVESVKDYLPKCNSMEFPQTFDEFAKDYGFTDDKEIYTNGSHLIPVFRVKQWLDHIEQQPSDETIKYLECNDIDVQKFTEAMKKQRLQVKPNICDDCISRQAVLDNAYAYGNGLEPDGYCVKQAVKTAILSMEKLERIEQIVNEHDNDSMPEDYWYIDRIREVLNG